MVDVIPGENFDIYKIEFLCRMRITVKEKNSRSVKQCYRCQLYGHSSATCKLHPKCRFCEVSHIITPKSCPNLDIKNRRPKCANCGSPHPSTYRRCEQNLSVTVSLNCLPIQGILRAPPFSHPRGAAKTSPAAQPQTPNGEYASSSSITGDLQQALAMLGTYSASSEYSDLSKTFQMHSSILIAYDPKKAPLRTLLPL